MQLSTWAERSDHMLLSLRFAEAAAACDPFDPVAANVAGRLARTLGLAQRAEEWYSRGIALARTRRWSASYVRGHLGLGTVWKERGHLRRAQDYYLRGASRAERSGLKWLAAEVHHDMLLLALSKRDFGGAHRCASRAAKLYPAHHDRVPALVHDFSLLCARRHVFAPALELLRRTVPHIVKPHERLIVWSTLALSAAGADDLAAYTDARRAVLESVERCPSISAAALMNLAFAAHLRRDWTAAEDAASKAFEAARQNPLLVEQATDAQILLRAVAQREPALAPGGWSPNGDDFSGLYAQLLRYVTRWHGRTWRSRKKQARPGEFGAV